MGRLKRAGNAPRSFRSFDSSGDFGLEVWAPDRESLYSRAARALYASMFDLRTVRRSEEHEIVLEGADIGSLMVRWLNELLFLLDSEGFIGARALVRLGGGAVDGEGDSAGEGLRLEAVLSGERYDSSRHRMKRYLKAATYHSLAVGRDESGLWRARVILDA